VIQSRVRYSVAAIAICMILIQKLYLTDRITNERTAYSFTILQSLSMPLFLREFKDANTTNILGLTNKLL
jgi:hypothetical protein